MAKRKVKTVTGLTSSEVNVVMLEIINRNTIMKIKQEIESEKI